MWKVEKFTKVYAGMAHPPIMIISEGEDIIADVHCEKFAHLMAAAPDLLSACIKARADIANILTQLDNAIKAGKGGRKMDSREMVKTSWLAGWDRVKNGSIKKELTDREINTEYPQYISHAFAQGMIDALHGDITRYDKLI